MRSEYTGRTRNFILRSALISVFFLCCLALPAAAEDTFKIDPIPDQIIWDGFIEVTGTASPGEDAIIGQYIIDGYCSDVKDVQGDPDPNQQMRGGSYSSFQGDKPTWEYSTSFGYKAPGDYTLVVWKRGEDQNKIAKNLRISYFDGNVKKIEVYEPGASGPVLNTTSAEENSFYYQTTYTTPGSEMNLVFTPDLSRTDGKIAKGDSLTVSGQAVPGKKVLIWIGRKSSSGSNIYNKAVIFETDDEGNIIADKEILSENETKELLSACYPIYAVSGTDEELEENEEKLKLYSGLPYLGVNEDKNPYQKFMLLLEEPWIRFSETEDGYLQDVARGSEVNFTGTTNLGPGSELVFRIEPSYVPDSGVYAAEVTGIRVSDGDPHNWSVSYDTSSSGTGEFVVTISDPDGLASSSALLNIYDPAFSTGNIAEDSLYVDSYNIDPVTKDITTKKPSSNTAGTAPTAVIIFEAGLIFIIAVCAVVIYKKR
jgi:hypothetical protein